MREIRAPAQRRATKRVRRLGRRRSAAPPGSFREDSKVANGGSEAATSRGAED